MFKLKTLGHAINNMNLWSNFTPHVWGVECSVELSKKFAMGAKFQEVNKHLIIILINIFCFQWQQHLLLFLKIWLAHPQPNCLFCILVANLQIWHSRVAFIVKVTLSWCVREVPAQAATTEKSMLLEVVRLLKSAIKYKLAAHYSKTLPTETLNAVFIFLIMSSTWQSTFQKKSIIKFYWKSMDLHQGPLFLKGK